MLFQFEKLFGIYNFGFLVFVTNLVPDVADMTDGDIGDGGTTETSGSSSSSNSFSISTSRRSTIALRGRVLADKEFGVNRGPDSRPRMLIVAGGWARPLLFRPPADPPWVIIWREKTRVGAFHLHFVITSHEKFTLFFICCLGWKIMSAYYYFDIIIH